MSQDPISVSPTSNLVVSKDVCSAVAFSTGIGRSVERNSQPILKMAPKFPILEVETQSSQWNGAMEARHLDTRRRSTSLTAMGWWPPFFFLLVKSVAPQEVRGDGSWGLSGSQEIDKPGEGSQHLVGLVRRGTQNSFPKMAGV